MPDIDLKKNSILKQALMKALEGGELFTRGELLPRGDAPAEEVAPEGDVPEEENFLNEMFDMRDEPKFPREGNILEELIKRFSE